MHQQIEENKKDIDNLLINFEIIMRLYREIVDNREEYLYLLQPIQEGYKSYTQNFKLLNERMVNFIDLVADHEKDELKDEIYFISLNDQVIKFFTFYVLEKLIIKISEQDPQNRLYNREHNAMLDRLNFFEQNILSQKQNEEKLKILLDAIDDEKIKNKNFADIVDYAIRIINGGINILDVISDFDEKQINHTIQIYPDLTYIDLIDELPKFNKQRLEERLNNIKKYLSMELDLLPEILRELMTKNMTLYNQLTTKITEGDELTIREEDKKQNQLLEINRQLKIIGEKLKITDNDNYKQLIILTEIFNDNISNQSIKTCLVLEEIPENCSFIVAQREIPVINIKKQILESQSQELKMQNEIEISDIQEEQIIKKPVLAQRSKSASKVVDLLHTGLTQAM